MGMVLGSCSRCWDHNCSCPVDVDYEPSPGFIGPVKYEPIVVKECFNSLAVFEIATDLKVGE